MARGCSKICSYVSSILGCWVIICWIGLCGLFDLEVMRSDRAIFLKFRGTRDKGWLWLRFVIVVLWAL